MEELKWYQAKSRLFRKGQKYRYKPTVEIFSIKELERIENKKNNKKNFIKACND